MISIPMRLSANPTVPMSLNADSPIPMNFSTAINNQTALSDEAKQALLDCFAHVAWIDEDGQDYYDALYNALYPPATLVSISAVYTQSGTVYTTTSLDDLKTDLVVTATYDDASTETVTTYTLSGTLTVGTSTVTVSYGGKTTTFTVTVSAIPTVSSISAVYTQSGTVYTTDTLDSLKDDLVVTATYSDTSTAVVPSADYTLSGTLTVGTSTITVSYEGKTTTFTVTVTLLDNSIYNWDFKTGIVDSKQGASATLGAGVTQSSAGLSWATAANAYAYLCNMSAYATASYTIEVDVDSIVISPQAYNTCFINLSNGSTGAREYGIEWDYTNLKWIMRFNGTSATADRNITSSTYFNGKTVKLQMDYANSKAYLYVEGTLESTFTLSLNKSNGRNYVTLGANSQARSMQSGTVITGVRIYEGLV